MAVRLIIARRHEKTYAGTIQMVVSLRGFTKVKTKWNMRVGRNADPIRPM